jgi:toxin-antitoxin system PIN domain toxin
MTLYFPDLNVWLALSVEQHTHHFEAWKWMSALPAEATVAFSRYTQIGFLRLLTNQSAMSSQVLTLSQAWDVYDRWLNDPIVEFFPEPRGVDAAFRQITAPLAAETASKAVGDCWLLAHASEIGAALVTFDRALYAFARKHGHAALIPA